MERPERIVLFMIGAFTNRMAAVLWVMLVLSVATVFARIYYTWRALNDPEMKGAGGMIRPERDLPMPFRAVWHALYWNVRARHLAVRRDGGPRSSPSSGSRPPDWLGDPTAQGAGPVGWLVGLIRGR